MTTTHTCMLQMIVSTHNTKSQALTAAEALVGCQTDYLVDVESHRARWAVVVMHDGDSDQTVLANLLQAMLRVAAK